jgi:hypothetical protein
LKFGGIDWTPTPAWYFAVLDSPKFVVLHPKVRLEDFGGGQESEDRRVPLGECAAVFLAGCEHLGASGCRSGGHESFCDEGTSVR